MSDFLAEFSHADIAASTYEYSRPQRNPVAWILAALVACMAFYGAILGASLTFWICLAFFAVVNLWVIWGKTTHGIRIDDQTLTVSPARDPIVISRLRAATGAFRSSTS